MTEHFAMTYIPKRMDEVGIGSEYFLRYRHFVLKPDEVRKLNAGNDFFFLLSPLANIDLEAPRIRVESEFGFYDLEANESNELTYDHRGMITLTNLDEIEYQHVQFIQVIPKNK